MNAEEIRDIGRQNLTEMDDIMSSTGFQSAHIGKAGKILKNMSEKEECSVMLSFTANLMASGLRGLFKDLVREGVVDAVITTGGAIDHDIIRAYEPYFLGDFDMDDDELHEKEVNRIGNILVPNERYALLEEKIRPVLKELSGYEDVFTPSVFIEKTAEILDNDDMFIKKCLDNHVPVFCPGMIDSAIGLQIYLFRQDKPDFMIDDSGDLKKLHEITLGAKQTGGLIIGGGISKHHLIGSNLLRGGLDYAVYLTTASEYDGSLSGARPREGKSWGKITKTGKTATVVGDATITLPIILSSLWKKKGLSRY